MRLKLYQTDGSNEFLRNHRGDLTAQQLMVADILMANLIANNLVDKDQKKVYAKHPELFERRLHIRWDVAGTAKALYPDGNRPWQYRKLWSDNFIKASRELLEAGILLMGIDQHDDGSYGFDFRPQEVEGIVIPNTPSKLNVPALMYQSSKQEKGCTAYSFLANRLLLVDLKMNPKLWAEGGRHLSEGMLLHITGLPTYEEWRVNRSKNSQRPAMWFIKCVQPTITAYGLFDIARVNGSYDVALKDRTIVSS